MILVSDPDPERPDHRKVRLVLERGEMKPSSLLEVRMILRKSLEDLPNDIRQLTIIEDRRRPT